MFRFKEGKPSIIIPNSNYGDNTDLVLFYYLSFTVFVVGTLILDLSRKSASELNLASRAILLMLNMASFFWLISTDPGIVSISDPVINIAELARYQK